MPFDVISYALIKKHKALKPLDHSDRSVTRVKLEYPTENVSFGLLQVIDKAVPGYYYDTYGSYPFMCLLTTDWFTDKAVASAISGESVHDLHVIRLTDPNTYYAQSVRPYKEVINKKVGGTVTTLASEPSNTNITFYPFLRAFSISGSTLKTFRDRLLYIDVSPYKDLFEFVNNLPNINPILTATDTDIPAGRFGFLTDPTMDRQTIGAPCSARLLPPASKSLPAKTVLEVDIEGSGKPGDPYRPKIPEGVAWGAFEFNPSKASSVVVTVFDCDNIQNVNAKRVFKQPKDYGEATDLYKKLIKDHPEWLAGKDSFIYQTLGTQVLEYFGSIDFYYGELLEHKTHYQQLKQVNPYEVENRLNELISKLSTVTVLTEERDKHISKAKEVLKKGW